MVKVSVMYLNKSDARFDQAYYLDKHMPMVKARTGPTLKAYAFDKGVVVGNPGELAPYLAVAHRHCTDLRSEGVPVRDLRGDAEVPRGAVD